ncbi:hypothetical protein BHM03_00035569 [Ensete ventricosum]|nr:hypothetical protein BHM03_00035569 [Ensete ventricosum]
MHSISLTLPVEITAVHERRTWGEFITRMSSFPPLSTTRPTASPRTGSHFSLCPHVADEEAQATAMTSSFPGGCFKDRVSTGRAPFPGLSGDTGGRGEGGRETERTLAGKATADASPLSLSTQIQMLALRVVNEPLESISLDLGFTGNTLAEGLVVSMCLGGALIGCLFSGLISDGIGRRRSFQLSALPMIIGASLSICGIIMSYSQVAYPSFLTGSVVAMLLMDILGRKFLLAGSFLGMVKSVLAFSLGAGPVPSLLLPEIFPNKIRAKAVALCMSVHWVMTNVVETKGKTLQEIEVALLSAV